MVTINFITVTWSSDYVLLLICFFQRDLFEVGHGAYYSESWTLLVESMENGLLELFSALEDCRKDCTGPIRIQEYIFGFSEVSLRGI